MALPLDPALTNYNQHTGRFNFARNAANDVIFDQSQAYAVQTALGCIQGAYAFDQTLGSQLAQLKHLTSRTPSQAVATAQDALESLVRNNQILPNPAVTATPIRNNNGVTVLAGDVSYGVPGQAAQNAQVQL